MGASFIAANTQFLENTAPPFITIPFTVGLWLSPTVIATSYLWHLASGGSASLDGWDIQLGSGGALGARGGTSGVVSAATTTGTCAVRQWTFVIARQITTTNRRIDVLFASGATEHVQNTVARTPTGPITRESLGCSGNVTRVPYGGLIGEFWKTNTDIQPDGAALSDQTLLKLAFNGPFSIPAIRYNLTDYLSLRKSISSDGYTEDDYFMGNFGKQTWTNNAGATVGAHPPAANTYTGPNGSSVFGII